MGLLKRELSQTQNTKRDPNKDYEENDKDISLISLNTSFELKNVKGPLIRRRSCLCKWCGGISKFETKHQDIVSDLQAYGRNKDKKNGKHELDKKEQEASKLHCNFFSL